MVRTSDVAMLASLLGLAAALIPNTARADCKSVIPQTAARSGANRAITARDLIELREIGSPDSASFASPSPFAISPDGTRVAYSVGDPEKHDSHVVQRSLTQSRVMRLTQPTPGEEIYPVWSPDGATIAFARHAGDDCEIRLVPALGGPERRVDHCFTGAVNYFSWAPDGQHLVTTMPSTSLLSSNTIA